MPGLQMNQSATTTPLFLAARGPGVGHGRSTIMGAYVELVPASPARMQLGHEPHAGRVLVGKDQGHDDMDILQPKAVGGGLTPAAATWAMACMATARWPAVGKTVVLSSLWPSIHGKFLDLMRLLHVVMMLLPLGPGSPVGHAAGTSCATTRRSPVGR